MAGWAVSRRCLRILGEGRGLQRGMRAFFPDAWARSMFVQTCPFLSVAGRELGDHLGLALPLTEKETEAPREGTDRDGGSNPGSFCPARHVPAQVPHLEAPFPLAGHGQVGQPALQGFVRLSEYSGGAGRCLAHCTELPL